MGLCVLIHHYQPDLMYICVCMFVCVCVCDGVALCALIHHYQLDLMYVCVCMFVFVCIVGSFFLGRGGDEQFPPVSDVSIVTVHTSYHRLARDRALQEGRA